MIHPTRTTVSPVMTRNATCQPTTLPTNVPAGTPRDSATGIPAMATAMALPSRCAGAIRRA